MKKSARYLWVSVVTLVLLAASLPLIMHGSQSAIHSMFNTPRLWVPPTFPARREFIHFTEQFRAQQVIVVSWPACTLDDLRLLQFTETMRSAIEAGGEKHLYGRYFTQVTSGYTLVRQLTSEPLNLSRPEAIRRLQGTLVGPDGETSCAAVSVTPAAAREREEALELILQTLDQTVGLPRETYHLAGTPLDGIAIDRESIRSIRRHALPSAVLSLLLCWLCLRSLWLTLPVMVAAYFGQGLVMSSVHYTGVTMNAILIVMPPLIFVLTVSAGVHLVNYYYEALQERNRVRATRQALANGWVPCFVAALTTAIGVGSLLVSTVSPVRQFGALGAMGVMVTFALLLLLLPGAMQTWPWSDRRIGWQAPSERSASKETLADRFWRRLAARVSRSHTLIAAAGIAAILLAAYGLIWIRTSVNAVHLLPPENPHMQDLRWFETHIGPLIPMEVVVHIGRDDSLDLLEKLDLVRQVEQGLQEMPNVGGTMSAATFAPRPPRGASVRATVARALARSRLEDRLPAFEAAHYLSRAEYEQSWRISARVMSSDRIDYGRFLDTIRRQIEPIVDRYRGPGTDIRVTYTGVTSVVYEVQRELLNDLFRSYLTAFALVTVVMVLVLRNLGAGLVAMIPNIFPAIILFGVMGWTGTAVDIGSVMTASVALGIAVDGTIHFLNWFRRELQRGATPDHAIALTYRHCGQALVQTTLIIAVGLVVYTNSGFIPARRFSWMILLLLLGALMGDLLLLPSLLLGRWGKFFRPSGPIDERPISENGALDEDSNQQAAEDNVGSAAS
ncbi:MAG: efflux RND transporter permease subunit [Pirellulaceae bacterium]